jgi:cytochrome c oxidase subunit 4
MENAPMSSTEHRIEPDTAAKPTDPPEQHIAYHPSAREYVRVGLLLIALTCIEVALSYSSLAGTKLVVALFTVIKFVLVVGYFMHLKFDNGRFSRVFALGAIGAFTLYCVVLLMFRVWAS